jgi:hypothetical protein
MTFLTVIENPGDPDVSVLHVPADAGVVELSTSTRDRLRRAMP